ncbi:MAG: flagellar hook-basal body complex protein FliE [Velocimicrobium sp.]
MSGVNAIGGIYDSSRYNTVINNSQATKKNNNASFESLFQSASSMINETNSLTNAAEEEEINFALGVSTNPHDLQVAQKKANISLQYTVAVRNSVMDAYKEIMNLQF